MAKVKIPDDLVVFKDSQGNMISNDPRFHALQTLGIDVAGGGKEAPVTKAAKPAKAPKAPKAEEAEEETGLDADGNRTYKELKGKDLSAFAKERGVEIKGLNAGEVRALLIEQDAESTEDEEEEELDEEEDDDSDDEESEDDEDEE